MMRERTSRPSSSVPSGKSREGAPGSPNVLVIARVGSCGARDGAKAAITMRLNTIAAPRASIVLSAIFISRYGSVSGAIAHAEARVDPDVKQVNTEVGDDDQK